MFKKSSHRFKIYRIIQKLFFFTGKEIHYHNTRNCSLLHKSVAEPNMQNIATLLIKVYKYAIIYPTITNSIFSNNERTGIIVETKLVILTFI